MKTTTATPWIQHPRFLKILYPTLVAVAMVLLWQGAVSYFRIPAFLVPSPLVMLESLWTHLTPLLLALLFTLKITLISFLLSIVIGAAVAFIRCRTALWKPPCFPTSCFAGDADRRHRPADHHLGERCHALAGGVRHPDGGVSHHLQYHSGTAQRLPGLLSYFRLNHASRWQTLVRLRIPSALPYFFGALRISSGLSLIGAVVAEFVAGTGGTNTGLAYQILQAGYQLDISLMFAALLLISRRYRAVWRDVRVSRRALSAGMKAKPCNLINVLLTNRKRMMTDEQRQHAVAAIQQALPALEWTLQPAKIKRLSRDFHWFSPLLTEQLAGKQADAVVRPRDEEELRQLVCACAQHQLPLTLRAAPPATTDSWSPRRRAAGGYDRAQPDRRPRQRHSEGPGIRPADIETAARPTGWELRCMPSTYRLASRAVSTAAGSAASAPSTMGRWRRPAMCSASK